MIEFKLAVKIRVIPLWTKNSNIILTVNFILIYYFIFVEFSIYFFCYFQLKFYHLTFLAFLIHACISVGQEEEINSCLNNLLPLLPWQPLKTADLSRKWQPAIICSSRDVTNNGTKKRSRTRRGKTRILKKYSRARGKMSSRKLSELVISQRKR